MSRIRRTLLVIVSILTLITIPKNSLSKSFSWKDEIESLQRVDRLPSYRTGEYVEQVSSYDTTGGNDDGFNGTYSYIRKEGNDLVLADLQGPGVIERIWTPTPTTDSISFFFDGEETARLKLRFSDLFSGDVYPFVRPISGNEIGGYYTYFPIPYSKSCKIVFHGSLIKFHQIQYRNLPNQKVDSYTATKAITLNSSIESVNGIWNNISPTIDQYSKGLSQDVKSYKKSFTLNPKEEVNFFKLKKGGRIVGFEINAGDAFEGIYKDVILKGSWDGEDKMAINAPIADFFGYAYGKPAMRSILIGRRADINYCYLPAPFDKSAQLSLEYATRKDVIQPPINIEVTVYYNDTKRDRKNEGKLYTTWRRENPAKTGEYYRFAKLKGKGHYVGTINISQGLQPDPAMTVFFEGDDSTYVDRKMRLHGTGSEDYFNGGWYAMLDRWDRGVSLPIHGSLDYNLAHSRTGGYRFYLSDKIPYEEEIYMGIEHGPEGNKYPVDYTSVAFYYSANTPSEEVMNPIEALRTVIPPNEFIFYPNVIMDFAVSPNVRTHVNNRALVVESLQDGDENILRIPIETIQEGHYEVLISYYTRTDGGEFSVWQRQNPLQGWKSTYSTEDNLIYKENVGQIYLTPQTNSISIRLKGKNKIFELQRIYLKSIN